MAKLIVIGAGPMGLAAAYYAARSGVSVEVIEAGDQAGGMAAHFDFGGLSLERFYHFCCRGDVDTFALMAELGLDGAMRWTRTRMGYFIDGGLAPFGDPISLLRFPHLGLVDKIRYGAMALLSTRRGDWRRLDLLTARQWLTAWCGRRAYDRLWRPLLELKFFEYADQVSAAWVWRRIKRLGTSRRSIFQEELGYIDGGSRTLIDALGEAIIRLGGVIRLGAAVESILVEGGKVTGVEMAGGEARRADLVICTAPLPRVAPMLARFAPELAAAYAQFNNIGVVCVIHKLRRSVSSNFWVNISDPAIDIPGFVEFSNLRPTGDVIVYVPYYMPASHPKFSWTDAALAEESFGYLRRVNPALLPADRIDVHVGRLRYAQPVCDTGFAARIPDPRTPVKGLHIADTSFYYPEDRGISESIRYARRLVDGLEVG